MSTTKKTTSTNQYSPTGMAAYNQMTPAFSGAATSYINNPFGNPFFQTQQQMGTNQANQLGQTGVSNIMNNMTTSGFGGSPMSPFAQEMLANQGRATSGLRSQLGFLSPVQNAMQMQQNAMGMAAGYSPLQTGQTQVQKQSGLGTWLPAVGSMALGGFLGGHGLIPGLTGQQQGGGMAGSPGVLNAGAYTNNMPGFGGPMAGNPYLDSGAQAPNPGVGVNPGAYGIQTMGPGNLGGSLNPYIYQ